MIEPLIGIGIFAALFAAFGALKPRSCGSGSCGACSGGPCSYEKSGEGNP
ncbi:MAG: hypothetical protein WEB88_10275 [Gemmatimonadota bacterium]